ncbi:MAG TPA: PoNe immunity protein domain-containing protein [Hymenobacter sp.]|jgi:hypothetical protein
MKNPKREPLMTESYFDKDIEMLRTELAILDKEKNLPAEEIYIELVYQSEYNYRFNLLAAMYSHGYPVTQLKQDFPAVVLALEKFIQHPKSIDLFFDGEMDGYTSALALISLGLLLHVEMDVFRRMVAAIGANGQDFVLEWLIGRRLPDRPRTTQLLFPKTYARLRDAIQAPRDIQGAVLKVFLAGWYESLDTVWYECHRAPEGGGFTGYWCWEAAAVACFLGADDGELRAMRYYPTDLADYAYGRKLQSATDPG